MVDTNAYAIERMNRATAFARLAFAQLQPALDDAADACRKFTAAIAPWYAYHMRLRAQSIAKARGVRNWRRAGA